MKPFTLKTLTAAALFVPLASALIIAQEAPPPSPLPPVVAPAPAPASSGSEAPNPVPQPPPISAPAPAPVADAATVTSPAPRTPTPPADAAPARRRPRSTATNAPEEAARPPRAARSVAPAPSGEELDDADTVGPILLVNESRTQIITLLERLSGKTILASQTLPVLSLNLTISADSTRSQAVDALINLLAVNGVVLTPVSDDDTQTLKAIPATNAALEALRYTTSTQDLPVSGLVISRLFTLNFTTGQRIEQTLRSMVNTRRGGSVIVTSPNSILFTDSIDVVQKVERIVEGLDAPNANTLLFQKMKHIRAADALKHLRMLQVNQNGMPTNIIPTDITIEVDDFTNQLLIVTPEQNKVKFLALLEDMDKESETTVLFFKLKHIRATEVMRHLKTLQVGVAGLKAALPGDVTVEADDLTNDILIVTPPQNEAKLRAIITEMDKPSQNTVLFFRFKHIRATEAMRQLKTLQASPTAGLRLAISGDVALEADDLANHLIVVTLPENEAKLRSIVAEMDKETTNSVMFFKVEHIRASDVMKQLRTLQSGQNGGLKLALSGDIAIEADDLANQVMVISLPQNEAKLREIISKMDQESIPKTVTDAIGLKHSDAATVFNILKSVVTGDTAANARNTAGTTNNRSTGGSSLGGVSTAVNTYSTYSFTTRQGAGTSTSTARTAAGGVQTLAVATPGTPNTYSQFLNVTAEERSNRLIVVGTEDDLKQIRELVEKIDVPLAQVRIEAVVVEVTLTTGEASGLDTLGLGYKASAGVGTVVNPNYNFNTSMPIMPGGSAPPFAITGSLRDFSLEVVFNEAEHNSRVRILSAPLISTSHNQPASIFVGQEHPFITGTTSDLSNSTTTRSSVESRQIGLSLNVTPRVGADGSVEMKVDQSNKSIIGTTKVDNTDQPITADRSASAYLIADHNETVVLAGLQSYRERESNGVVWLLGYIPFIGELFKPNTNDTERTEIIIFLKPHIINRKSVRKLDDLPGMTPGALTRIDAKSYLENGRFSAISLTEAEREALEVIRRRQNEQSKATREEQLANEKAAEKAQPTEEK
ncbi:MAG: hypothetical protein LBV54_05915 [Puniceicoccales bacterium]|jgi:general secretion pathway protein D|nr:hypothetical protein [Puniceicoccales bacterium]